ncbi:MAG: family 20 glycosylhydrolase [Planctomycetes bacterium]|nr:family 20 glycosylhydrolase [Planctomycetota bacterium]
MGRGVFRVAAEMVIQHGPALEAPELAAVHRLQGSIGDLVGLVMPVTVFTSDEPAGGIIVRIAAGQSAAADGARRPSVRPAPTSAAQGYTLCIVPDHTEIIGNSPAGLFHGLQTLHQIALLCGAEWPCLEVADAPDFPVRGLSYDVSRGRVPTLATLKLLVDRLALLKINQLQLYVEHTFAFRFNPNIGCGCAPLTADEIRELDAYCALHHIDLVPSLASFGHMGFILALPEYRHLAEVEASKSWAEMTWTDRMRGLTLDATSAESRELLTRMYAEFLPLFSAPYANVCCDETYDLGRGKTKELVARQGLGELYLEHLRFLAQLCRQHGKQPMFWGDVIKKHPALIEQIPADAIVLNWDYAPEGDYESTALFRRAGLTTFVCPGTSSWNRILNDINAAELNIRRHAAAGLKYGAAGLLNTDWGDEGHVNQLASSWHPMALGAALAWNVSGPGAAEFDRAFGRLFLGDDSGAVVALLRGVARVSDLPRSWPEFCRPLTVTVPEELLSSAKLTRWRELSGEAAEVLHARPRTGAGSDTDLDELELSCRLNALVAERFELSRALAARAGVWDRALAERLTQFAGACEQFMPAYEAAWLARHKRARLDEITAVFRRLAEEARFATQHGRGA